TERCGVCSWRPCWGLRARARFLARQDAPRLGGMLGLHKIPHPKNFAFAEAVSAGEARSDDDTVLFSAELEDWGEDVFRLTARSDAPAGPRLAHIVWSGAAASSYRAELCPNGELRLSPREDTVGPTLGGLAGGSLGVCGAAWMLRLVSEPE